MASPYFCCSFPRVLFEPDKTIESSNVTDERVKLATAQRMAIGALRRSNGGIEGVAGRRSPGWHQGKMQPDSIQGWKKYGDVHTTTFVPCDSSQVARCIWEELPARDKRSRSCSVPPARDIARRGDYDATLVRDNERRGIQDTGIAFNDVFESIGYRWKDQSVKYYHKHGHYL